MVSPMAETTTTTSLPAALAAATRSATFRMRETSETEDPPYFWTITFMPGRRGSSHPPFNKDTEKAGLRRPPGLS